MPALGTWPVYILSIKIWAQIRTLISKEEKQDPVKPPKMSGVLEHLDTVSRYKEHLDTISRYK